jgi:hypothetical protein
MNLNLYNQHIFRYTRKDKVVYAVALDWPGSGNLSLGVPNVMNGTHVTLLGYDQELTWSKGSKGGIVIHVPAIPVNKLNSKWAWTFKLENVD